METSPGKEPCARAFPQHTKAIDIAPSLIHHERREKNLFENGLSEEEYVK